MMSHSAVQSSLTIASCYDVMLAYHIEYVLSDEKNDWNKYDSEEYNQCFDVEMHRSFTMSEIFQSSSLKSEVGKWKRWIDIISIILTHPSDVNKAIAVFV